MSNTLHTKSTHDRATVLLVAAKIECDPRTARRILRDGAKVIRTEAIRERAERVLAEMGFAA